jgi:ribosomal protein S18 acetylase RimI-like enzyme
MSEANAVTSRATAPQPTAEPISVRRANAEDLPRIAALHMAAFPELPTTQLGSDFMMAFYRSFLDEEIGFCLLACRVEGRVLGFIAGSTDVRAQYRHFYSRHIPMIALAAVRQMRRAPGFGLRLLGYWRRAADVLLYILRRVGGRRSAPPPASAPTLCLVFIAVAEEARGLGVGGALLAPFEEEARRRGCTAIEVRADARNDGARRFYERFGFAVEGGDGTLRFRKRLAPTPRLAGGAR